MPHNDKLLWVSLHHTGGIVSIRVDPQEANLPAPRSKQDKAVMVYYPGNERKDSFYIPVIKTGKPPRIIARTGDSRHLLVSNWHSFNVSVLETAVPICPHCCNGPRPYYSPGYSGK